jgi:DNA replication protein DnaC
MAAAQKFEQRLQDYIRQRGIRHATDAEMEAKEQEIRREQAEHKARILLGRLDSRYRDAVLRHDASHRWLTDYRLGNRHGYVILGRHGAGKTWEACALARKLLMEDSVPVTLVTATDLMQALRPNRDGASDLGAFQVAPVLVLDDLGAERPTEWTHEQLFRLADFRNVRKLPVIITTNLTGPQLRERYDPRMIDRLVEDATLLDIATGSYRSVPL